jgi:membrane-associated phospholipid phosphatase
VIAALIIRVHPGRNALDRWGFSTIAKSPQSALFIHGTQLGSPVALVIGCLLAAAVAFPRDRWRAAACILGPLATAVVVEVVAKPLIGRRYQEVLSYPSGNVADVAALATAWVIAVPRWLRAIVIIIAAAVIVLITASVIGLRWHYPTDALGGAVLGVGMVLTVDGLVHLRRPSPASLADEQQPDSIYGTPSP